MSEYSPDEFYTHATDKKGHCVSIRTAVPPTAASAVDAYVASPLFPSYKTSQDVMRDALFHRLQWLEDNMTGQSADDIATWQAQIAIEKEAEWHRSSQKLVQDINDIRMNAMTELDMKRFREVAEKALDANLPETVRLELLRILT